MTSAAVPTPSRKRPAVPRPRTQKALLVESPEDVATAARLLAAGSVVGQPFGNIYALTARPDADAARWVNVLKGRPPEQAGSIVTSPLHIRDVFDWTALPAGVTEDQVLGVMDALLAIGPIGFRGPAVDAVPDHLSQADGEIRTAQIVAPGLSCPSAAFVAAALAEVGEPWLYATSANRSRRVTGAADEPPHCQGQALAAEFAGEPGFVLLAHGDEDSMQARYPRHDAMSTSILAFSRTGGTDVMGRPCLVLERHGSLPASEISSVLARFGLGLVVGPGAATRLSRREYLRS